MTGDVQVVGLLGLALQNVFGKRLAEYASIESHALRSNSGRRHKYAFFRVLVAAALSGTVDCSKTVSIQRLRYSSTSLELMG
jgi:hypothetical protein